MPIWDDQLERMERYYRRCEAIRLEPSVDSVEDDNDTIYSFFLNCYHLTDWLSQDSTFQHRPVDNRRPACSNPSCARCFVKQNRALKLCQQLCNGIKHLNSNSCLPGREVNHVDGRIRFYIRWRYEDERGRVVDTHEEVFPAISQARDAWKEFIVRTKGVPSTEFYDMQYGTRLWKAKLEDGQCRTMEQRGDELPDEAWREITVAQGSQGPRSYQFSAQRVRPTAKRKPGEIHWAVWRRNLDGSEPRYYLSNAPEDTPLETLAYVGGSRWRIETEFETEKGDVGLDEYETRSWAGWHHHIAMCLLGGAFLLNLQQDWGEKDAPDHPSTEPALV